jgi:hypothetical protein
MICHRLLREERGRSPCSSPTALYARIGATKPSGPTVVQTLVSRCHEMKKKVGTARIFRSGYVDLTWPLALNVLDIVKHSYMQLIMQEFKCPSLFGTIMWEITRNYQYPLLHDIEWAVDWMT